VTARAAGAGLAVAAVALSGCVSRVDFNNQDRQLRDLMRDNRRQIEAVQHEVERLRALVEEGGPRRKGAGSLDDRLSALEQRLQVLEGGRPPGDVTPSTDATPPDSSPVPPAPIASAPTTTLPPAPPKVPPEDDDEWRREVAREQAAVGSMNIPERAEYLAMLDGLARKDCGKAVGQLNGFAAARKESALADNALYWVARCYALKGDQNQAITKFYDVVMRYPKGDKAPAALWVQGNLFIDIGDTPDARLAFSRLIRDYPSTDEAARARQKLSTL
jgi:TolA-binding protein